MATTAGTALTANRIESLLSARLFVEPQLEGERVYFISSLSGHLSLYSMPITGGVPEPLLPPQIALQNPELVGGHPFDLLPELGRIVLMIDRDGDENYQPLTIPLEGGFPEPVDAESFEGRRSHLMDVDPAKNIAYFAAESREEAMIYALRADLATGEVEQLGQSPYGAFPMAWTPDHSRVVLGDGYTAGDVILYEPDGEGGRRMLFGTPIDEREEGVDYPPSGFEGGHAVVSGNGVLVGTTLLGDDTGTPGFIAFDRPGEIEPVAVEGLVHDGIGELEGIQHLAGDRYALRYNIDGCSWAYESVLRRRRAHAHRAARARGRGRPRGRRPPRPRPRRGQWPLRALLLHGDDADAAVRARSGSSEAVAENNVSARSASTPRCCRPERTRRSTRTTAFGCRRASISRRRSSASRGRGRSSTTSTAGRRARSARTSRGSRCR